MKKRQLTKQRPTPWPFLLSVDEKWGLVRNVPAPTVPPRRLIKTKT